TTDSYGTGGNETFLVQLNAHGDEGWFTTFGGEGYDRGIGLSRMADGGFTVATLSCNPSDTATNCTLGVIRTDSRGNELGRTVIPVPGGADGTAFTTSAGGSGVIAFSTGGDGNNQTGGEVLLTVLDDTGAILSSRSYPSPDGLAVSGIAVAGDNYAITGSGTGAPAGHGPVIMLIGTGRETPGLLAPTQTAETGPGDLRVTVREADTGEIATDALVYLDGSAAGLTSESEGNILLQHVSEGGHSIRVTRDGFAETTKTVNIEGDQNLTVFLSPSKVIPVIVNGPPEGKIDVVFVASKTQYDCTNQEKVATDTYTANRTSFQQDVSNLISDNYLSLDQYTSGQIGLPSDYKDRFNFYYYWDKDNFADAFDGCAGTLPDHFWENAPFADVVIIVYPTYTGLYSGTCQPDGCASGLGLGTHSWVKVPADGGKLILHESGHAIFGLIDAYCGDTYYTEDDPFPNVWSTGAACSKAATSWNTSTCKQITGPALSPGSASCSKQFWEYDPEPNIMGVGVYSYFGKFGEAETTRIDYIFNNIGGVKKA
ncbi:PEGA domain-containing protein, partial [Methanoregula sp.]|uniref:PEGA domain-containing protein n=1 Tax=Methanoregula sp. TaxID=2052170 RepID=UPI003C71FA34